MNNSPAENVRIARALMLNAWRAWTASLPEFPADGICPDCEKSDDWALVEEGYSRVTKCFWNDADEDGPGYLHGQTDGWDDISESGDVSWVECECGSCFKQPEDLQYD